MSIAASDLRLLFQRSGNRCAFPNCGEVLTLQINGDDMVATSEVAHIVSRSLDGPRGTYPLDPDNRDDYSNLILLCEKHHHLVDAKPASFPVEMLRRWKNEHETLMQQATKIAIQQRQDSNGRGKGTNTRETVYSTLLPVLQMPKYIYSAPCEISQSDMKRVKDSIVYSKGSDVVAPFILRDGRLYCFNDLNQSGNPFKEVISTSNQVVRHHTRDWWVDDDKEGWFIYLLNQCLNKLTGRRGLNWDREHNRYFFQPSEVGQPLEVRYQPLNQSIASRQVVWNPITKETNLPKSYWLHLAVALRFHHVSSRRWCLSIRPEMHVSSDGIKPYPSEKKGSRITKRKSRRFNYDFLGDIQFWRDYLSDGRPRITLKFGEQQYLSISNELMHTQVEWPGTPEEHAKTFTNIIREEDLFTLSELRELEEIEEYWEVDDEDHE
ncbi:HNH endonuclease [Betaproteobacteria bacterium PRO4]|jgi:hypothetical protein|nr:HNH endonuclease [Betaproteobacteria bacterium PRO4]